MLDSSVMEEATQPEVRAETLEDELVKLTEYVHKLILECEGLRRENAALRLANKSLGDEQAARWTE